MQSWLNHSLNRYLFDSTSLQLKVQKITKNGRLHVSLDFNDTLYVNLVVQENPSSGNVN